MTATPSRAAARTASSTVSKAEKLGGRWTWVFSTDAAQTIVVLTSKASTTARISSRVRPSARSPLTRSMYS